MLTYEEVIALAKEFYNYGGDGIYECLSKADYDNDVANGITYTEENLLAEFATRMGILRDYEDYTL